MKIGITAKEATLEGELDPHFGRARKFILFDTETGAFIVHDNQQNLNATQGAGIQAAQNLAGLGAEILITGNVGPKAFQALSAAGIKVYLANPGTAGAALDAFRGNALPEATGATKEGHWV